MPKRLAVCIGVNKYRNLPSANLRYARQDAEALAALLKDPKRGGFDYVATVVDDNASKKQILDEIDKVFYAPHLTTDDLVLIYFSGHGAIDKGDNLFIVPHDLSFSADGTVNISTTVHIKDLEIRLDNTNTKQVIIILDACHSGASGKLLGRLKYSDDRNIVLVGAARYSEQAWEAPELEHGRFTECLLRAANVHPALGEWITLQQILAFVREEMQTLSSNQMIEVSSHAVNPNLCLFRNPLFSLNSQQFTEEIKQLCKLAGYQILSTQPNLAIPNLFIAREQLGFGRQSEMLVMCLDNLTVDVDDSLILQFRTIFQGLQSGAQISSGLVVTRNELPASLRALLAPLLLIQLRTKEQLQRNLIDFDRYFERLIAEFEKADTESSWRPPLKDYYVELDGKDLLASDEQQPVSHIVERWLANDYQPAAIILGGYGTGKTTFSTKIACDLAKNHLASSEKANHRIPILFYLRDFPRAEVDIEAFVISHLKRH